MIRAEFLFDGIEDVHIYLSRMALVQDSIVTGEVHANGTNYQEEMSKEEVADFKDYVWRVMQPIVDESVKYVSRKHNMKQVTEDFRQELYYQVWSNFGHFNNPKYRTQEASNSFRTFIRTYIAEPVRTILRQQRGLSQRLDYMIRKIDRTKDYLVNEIGMNPRDITPEDISMFMSEVSSKVMSPKQIVEVMKLSQPQFSMDSVENGEEQLNQVVLVNCVDPEFAKVIGDFIASLRPMQRFLFLQNYGFCSNRFSEVTIKQMSCDEVFLRICRDDEVGSKHIKHGELKIERPRIEVGERQTEVVYEDTDFVEEKFIRNERDRARKNLMNLVKEKEYKAEDFENVITNVLLEQWINLAQELGL